MNKYIDLNEATDLFKGIDATMTGGWVADTLEALPTIDIVLCKNCKASKVYQNDSSGVEGRFCEAFTQVRMVADDDFCSCGYEKSEE